MGIFLLEKGLTCESKFYLLFIGFEKNASGVVSSQSKIRAKMFSKFISYSSPSMINIKKFLFLIGVENKNDDLRKYYRPFEKKDTSFWIKGGKQESARKLLRITKIPVPESTQLLPTQLPTAQTGEKINEGRLRKKKVSELISLFQNKSGKTLTKRTCKHDIIAAILQYSERS